MSPTKKLLFSLVTILAFFLLVEGVLAVVGVSPLTATEDPLVGFSSRLPLMLPTKNETGEPILRTAPNKLVWFNDQRFVAKKPADTQRVFCVGGSTTFGRPYWDATSYSGWLRELLPVVDSRKHWEVINAGGVSYASYRVAAVMEELAQYEPDLFIVYSAHNEFLEHRTYADMMEQSDSTVNITAMLAATRTWSALKRLVNQSPPSTKRELLPAEVDEMLNHSVGPAEYHRDESWKRKVIEHYRVNLSRMIDIARRSGAAIVFITPASNEKDCSPFKSELDDHLATDRQDEFLRLYRRGIDQSAAGDHTSALQTFKNATEIDETHAGLHYEIGKSLLALMRHDQAQKAFRRALNDDVCPLRAIDEITLAIHSSADRGNVPVVDFEKQLRAVCQTEFGHQILGDEYFLDHVHPRNEVHQQLALWIISTLRESSLIDGDQPSEMAIKAVDHKIQSQIDPYANGVALRNLAKVLHWAGKFSEAAPRALDALELLPDDPESLLVLADCLTQMGRYDEALARYDHLLNTHSLYFRAVLPFAELLVARQEFDRAKPLLQSAIELYEANDPKHTRAQYFLGITHVDLGEFRKAIPLLQQVHETYPDEPRTLFYLAQSKSGVGENEQAIELYRKALVLDPDDPSIHQRIGLILLKKRQAEEAIKHFETALRLDPDNQQLHQHLEIARQLIE